MSTKVKGLLKGIRYISQIFEEKEEEFQIGVPTDVKHVAHIGSDDPSANAPSWMTDFKGGKAPQSGNPNKQVEERESKSKGSKIRKHLIPRSRHDSIDNDPDTSKQKATRRHNRSSDPSADSSNQESSSGSRHRRRKESNLGTESPSLQEMPPTSTKGHRRKSKNSEDDFMMKPSSRRLSKGDSMTEDDDLIN